MIAGLDAPCPAQYLMVQPQFGVVVNGASLQILPAGYVEALGGTVDAVPSFYATH